MVEKGRTSRGIVEVILLVVVMVVLGVGGYFVWQNIRSGGTQKPNVGQLTVLQTSDEASQIEQDLEIVETSSIDADLSSIEAEINAALSE